MGEQPQLQQQLQKWKKSSKYHENPRGNTRLTKGILRLCNYLNK